MNPNYEQSEEILVFERNPFLRGFIEKMFPNEQVIVCKANVEPLKDTKGNEVEGEYAWQLGLLLPKSKQQLSYEGSYTKKTSEIHYNLVGDFTPNFNNPTHV